MPTEHSMDLVNETSSQSGNGYEVFLSFRGEDTRPTFTSHLYSALCNAGIVVFKDDIELPRGSRIKTELLQAIGSSKIAIIIFSKDYAASKWCLDELSTIMRLHKSNDQVVLPVFYDVDPSTIRNPISNFGEAFKDLIQRIEPSEDQVSKWRATLADAGNLAGTVVFGSRDESEQIKVIVKNVCDILHKKDLFVPENTIGVDIRVQELIKMLQRHRSEDVIMVGIWGMGGVGKTTIAKVIYNEMSGKFENRCYLSNIRKVWNLEEVQVRLQNQLLSEICKTTRMKINSIESGKNTLKDRLRHKMALVVLDDVDMPAQLNALVGSRDWFGKGSRIIITTRDLHLLQAFPVDLVYPVKLLSYHESLQLFNRTAFKQAIPEGEFIELSRRMVAYAEGLPLALEVLGSLLVGKSSVEWESALRKLSTDLPSNIYHQLKLSFDSLDGNEKEIFVNIVLFYIGKDMHDVIQKLDGRGFNASIGIRLLVDRSLVTIDDNNKLRMHNLLQLMGRQTIRGTSQNELLNQGHGYDVFLSFRGDTRTAFILDLCKALCDDGISVFKDNVELPRGNHIKTEILQAIRSSKISIIIFSREYATSKRCLEELSIIMEFRKSNNQMILPVFYAVDPIEIHHQTSSFGKMFEDLIQRASPPDVQVSNWRRALAEVGGIKEGITVLGRWDEKEQVKAIVENVCDILHKKDLFVAQHPVGVDNRVQEVIAMLQTRQSKDVIMVGIWGMGGVGKTTIAKAIYNEIGHTFESRCCLSKIREFWAQEKDQVRLQKQLLSEICNITKMKINSIESGKTTLRDKLRHKKALVVLDDVDISAQLSALVGSPKWFGKGSRIIITTRDLHLLQAFKVDLVYSVKLLSYHESLQLLGRTAFKQASPEGEFIQLCGRMVAYAEGLPLALEVLGSFLVGKSSMEWESALRKLSTDLAPHIYHQLKLSFDSLDDNKKEIFVNIVLFYIGEDMHDVIQKLDGHGYNASIGIRDLEDRSLLTIDNKNKLRMHNLLQLMGRRIICETSQNELQYQGYRYEVFLSFRDEETWTTFTSRLYSALCNAGITVFKDDIELPKGNQIKMERLKAIGSSKISIIIFSKEFAGSKWCLEELSIIMELHKSIHHMVLPVFYNVDPSEIRYQTASFGEAFNDLIQGVSPPEHSVSRWRTALAVAGSIAGFVIHGFRDEKSEDVEAVVHHVCDKLDKKYLFVADHPVGVHNRVKEVITMLQNHQSEEVIMAGIWGMGGTGKTTIAKAIYNEIGFTFESRSFLSNIREAWGQKEGQVYLQNQLLSSIYKTTKMKINNIESGKDILRDRLHHKKALVVLDDVDRLAQLNALVWSRDWLKPGSIILITTRNQHLLHEMNCAIYPMKNLDPGESIKLLSWHAFKQESPREDFIELSRDIVAFSGGLPLALQVLGSFLYGREAQEWKSVLEKLKRIPFDKIQNKLKISFDGLDDMEKEIFLDIACFFVGMDKNEVTQILDGCGFFANIVIKILVERSLVTIDEKNKLGMHDLLRDMGREIIHEQSPKELGKRSRLWFPKDILAVLSKHMGTEDIEGLSLKWRENENLMNFETEAFKKMERLRLLRLENVQLIGDYKHMSRNLRWLCWHGCPLTYIPSNFYQQQLVVIDLKCSNLIEVWKEPQLLERLKILNLSHSLHLVETPDFSNLPNLEKLIVKDCPKLSTIHHSVGLLHELMLLDLRDCIGLHSLPRSVYGLKGLKTLNLSGCAMIEKLEEDIEQMESLTTLIAPTIKQVPFSLVRLKSILHLSVSGDEGSSRHVIPSLVRSWISPTNNPLPRIPTHAGMPSSFLWNMLNRIHGRHLPTILNSDEPKQQSLLLEDGLKTPDSLYATNCMDISKLENCLGHLLIQIGKNCQAFCTLSQRISQGLNLTRYNDDCVLPGDKYPYWLTFKGEGSSVKFEVPPFNGCDQLKGMAICCVYIPSGDLGHKACCESCIVSLMIINYTKSTTLQYKQDSVTSMEEAEWKEIISNLDSDDQIEVIAVFGNGFTVKKMVVYLIYKESFDEQIEASST